MTVIQPQTSWRQVSARIHFALSPQQLASGVRRAATRLAFDSLLMRYSPSLGGVVVAHRGGLKIQGAARFIAASPYPHLVATTNLLVFCPPRGACMMGVVTHVGPDHVAMSVMEAFNAVLPLSGLEDRYTFQDRKWCAKQTQWDAENPDNDTIEKGRQVRFLLSKIEPTRSRLFQIIASLDTSLRKDDPSLQPLGVVPRCDEVMIPELPVSNEHENGDDVAMNGHMLSISKRSKPSLESSVDIFAANEFGDSLMLGPQSETKPPIPKKRRRFSTGQIDGGDSHDAKRTAALHRGGEVDGARSDDQEIIFVSNEQASVHDNILTQIELPDTLSQPNGASSKLKESSEKLARRLEKQKRKEERKREKKERAEEKERRREKRGKEKAEEKERKRDKADKERKKDKKERAEEKERRKERKERRRQEKEQASNDVTRTVAETTNGQNAMLAAALSAVAVVTDVEKTARRAKELEENNSEVKSEKSLMFTAVGNGGDLVELNGSKKKKSKHSRSDSEKKNKRKRHSEGKSELDVESVDGSDGKKSKKRKRIKSELDTSEMKPSKKKKRESKMENL